MSLYDVVKLTIIPCLCFSKLYATVSCLLPMVCHRVLNSLRYPLVYQSVIHVVSDSSMSPHVYTNKDCYI